MTKKPWLSVIFVLLCTAAPLLIFKIKVLHVIGAPSFPDFFSAYLNHHIFYQLYGPWKYWSLMAVVWDQLKDTLRNTKDLHTIQKQKQKRVTAIQACLLIRGNNSFPLFSVFSIAVFLFISWEWVQYLPHKHWTETALLTILCNLLWILQWNHGCLKNKILNQMHNI